MRIILSTKYKEKGICKESFGTCFDLSKVDVKDNVLVSFEMIYYALQYSISSET